MLRNSDRAVRRPRDLEERLGLECLGLLPLVAADKPPEKHGGEVPKKLGKQPNKQMLAATERLAALVPNNQRPVQNRLDLSHKVLDDPFSHFSERLRSVKTALDSMAELRPVQCIGMISAVPGEGKSTIAVNLANVFAHGGRSTLLIDADLRNPELSRRLGCRCQVRSLELMAVFVRLNEATRVVSDGRLCFLPQSSGGAS